MKKQPLINFTLSTLFVLFSRVLLSQLDTTFDYSIYERQQMGTFYKAFHDKSLLDPSKVYPITALQRKDTRTDKTPSQSETVVPRPPSNSRKRKSSSICAVVSTESLSILERGSPRLPQNSHEMIPV